MPANTSQVQARHALLIGIDEYPKLNPLDGCVNDVHLMRSVLQEQYGFADADIAQLLNAEATRDAILEALDGLVNQVGKDDIVVIQYAGHGSQMTDREGDEPDGLDETIMPYDSEGWQGDNRDITDDELNLRLEELAKKTSYTTLIVDACHSGTITRDSFGAKARSMPPDLRPVEELPPSPIPAEKRRRLGSRGPSGWMPLTDSYVLMAGCRDDEVSFEYAAPAGEETVAHGAMTYFLAQELRNAEAGATYRDVFERVAAKVNAANNRQHPQMEGRVDREVFGVRDREPMRFSRVVSRDGDTLVLAAGSAHGATVGSRYAVYAQGTKSEEDASPLGTVEITAVRVVESDALIVEGAEVSGMDAGARAVESQHAHSEFRLSVEVVAHVGADEAAAASLRSILEGSPLLRVLDPGEGVPEVRAYVLAARSEAGKDDPVPQLGALADATLAVVDGVGGMLMPPRRVGDAVAVRANLELVARYRQLLALENSDPASELRGRFAIELLRHGPGDAWVLAEPEEGGGLVVYEEGDAIAFRISGEHPRSVFLSLLDFELTGGISQIHPAPDATEKFGSDHHDDPDDTYMAFEIGTRPGSKPFRVSMDEAPSDVSQAVEAVKLFVTSVPADLSVLSQSGTRSASPGRGERGLDTLLREASGGNTRKIVQPVGEDDWTTVVRPFVVRRRSGAALKSDGSALNLGSVSLVSNGVEGHVSAQVGASGRADAVAPTDEALGEALVSSGMRVQDTVLLTAPKRSRAGVAAGDSEQGMTLTVRAPSDGYEQLVLVTDDLGVMSWHLPDTQSTRSADGSRGSDECTYRIPFGEQSRYGGKGRGLAAKAAVAALKVFVFPKMEAAVGAFAQSRVEAMELKDRPYRVRWFGPEDFTEAGGRSVEEADWGALAAGRSLLFIHGTTSQAHSAFGDLSPETMSALHDRYQGRVFAFDHPTVSHDPRQNVAWLLEQIPDGLALDVDVVCHSRGGLVSRILAERQGDVAMGNRAVKVGQVVFVGSPNAGTRMADGRFLSTFLDTYTNMVCRIPGSMTVQALQVLLVVLKQLATGAEAGLVGLQSMAPGGEFTRWINDGKGDTGARYRAIASDYKASEAGMVRLATRIVADKVFSDPHDLVVPAASVYDTNGSGYFPINDRVVFKGTDAMSHVEYFGNASVQKVLLEWLIPS